MALGTLRVSSEDGALQSTASGQDEKVLRPRSLGEEDEERVDTSRERMGRKWKANGRKIKGENRKRKGGKGLRTEEPGLAAAGREGARVASAGGRGRGRVTGTRAPGAAGQTRGRGPEDCPLRGRWPIPTVG